MFLGNTALITIVTNPSEKCVNDDLGQAEVETDVAEDSSSPG